MLTNPYDAVHRRADSARGPAKYHCCYFCGLQACDWALNRESGHPVKRSEVRMKGGKLRRPRDYSESLDAYIPLCKSCHVVYDRASGPLDRPDLRERARDRVAAAHSAWRRWRGKSDPAEYRTCEQCAGPFWTTRGDTWCLFCRWPDVAAIVGDRRPRG